MKYNVWIKRVQFVESVVLVEADNEELARLLVENAEDDCLLEQTFPTEEIENNTESFEILEVTKYNEPRAK